MKRKKKISISYFLNDKLKPESNEKGLESYPIYAQINYNKKNTKIRVRFSNYGIGYKITKERFNELFINNIDSKINQLISEYEQTLRGIIYYEEEKLKDDFKLSKIQHRLNWYEESLGDIVLYHAIDDFQEWAKDYVVYRNYEDIFHASGEYDVLFFSVYFQTFKENNLINVVPKDILPDKFSIIAGGLIVFLNFIDTIELEDRVIMPNGEFGIDEIISRIRCIDWVLLDLKPKFHKYISNCNGYVNYGHNNKYGKGYDELKNDFPFEGEKKEEYFKYITVMYEKMFKQNINNSGYSSFS